MNTLLFTLEYPPFYGGVANYYGNLVKYWPANAGKIFVLSQINKFQEFKNTPNDVFYADLLGAPIWPRWIWSFFYLWRVVKSKNIDHIIVGHILPLGIVAYYFSRFLGMPYTVVLHGMDFTFSQATKRKEKISKKILNQAKNIICANSYTASLVKDILSEETKKKVRVVNPGINLNVPFITKGEKQSLIEKYHLEDKIVLFSIGRLVKRKGFDKVIEVMPNILSTIPNLCYVLAGTGKDEKYIKEKASDIKNIIFLGKISEREKWTWLSLCDIFIMPARNCSSDFEGFGIVYLEAGLMSKPVIAGDSGGVRDAVLGDKTGILVNPNNNSQIISAIIRLAQDQNLRHKLGQKGRERTIKQFNWRDKAKEFAEIIYNIRN